MEMLCLGQQGTNLLCHPENLRMAETTIFVTGSANRDEGNIPQLFNTRAGPERGGADGFGDGFSQLRLNNWTLGAINGGDLGGVEVDAGDVMSVLCQAGRDDGADITQTKNGNFHISFSCLPSLRASK